MLVTVLFAVFFVGVAFMVKAAVTSYEPPIDPMYQEKGLDYQKRLDEFDRAKERGWSAEINIFNHDTVTTGKVPLVIVVKKDTTKPAAETTTDDDRLAMTLIISSPASIKNKQEYTFKLSDFEHTANRMQLNRSIDIQQNGTVEISVEIRPDFDSAIYQSKKFALVLPIE